VQVVTDAMYAVGVGGPYVAGVQAGFIADFTEFCTYPATVSFSNQSNNATSFIWDFGDGTSSTQNSPSHTYTAYGDYTVKLYADGGNCGNDSLIEVSFVSIQPTNPCIFFMANQTHCQCISNPGSVRPPSVCWRMVIEPPLVEKLAGGPVVLQ